MSAEDLFISTSFPDIRELGKLPSVENQLELICDVQKIGDQCYYKYNQQLCLKWLKARTEMIRGGSYWQYACDLVIKEEKPLESLCILSQYVSKELLEEVCSELGVKLSQLEPK